MTNEVVIAVGVVGQWQCDDGGYNGRGNEGDGGNRLVEGVAAAVVAGQHD